MRSAAFITTVTASALAAGAALWVAIPALAAIGGAHTPGARAAAMVNADGTVERSTGVTAVRKINAGQYCIELDPDINAAKTVPVVSKLWNGTGTDIYISSYNGCGDTARNIFVITTRPAPAGGFADAPFNIVVD
ncbi:hypothetical protein [Nonomuraea sp. NPDC050786]|uniref:hypothetical protein n=1 Tax=Nonomuraea sp. NPDC050786 TaxID=3154840 RepID=UPI0033CDA37F